MKTRINQFRKFCAGALPVIFSLGFAVAWYPVPVSAQVNSGSNGSDGALDFSSINYPTNIVIDMNDHPNGIYQYTYVNTSSGFIGGLPSVIVTFIPNANNTPVVWLVQEDCAINPGTAVDVSAPAVGNSGSGGLGGPGGFRGGNGGTLSVSGQGPGGGAPASGAAGAFCGTYATAGIQTGSGSTNGSAPLYGNQFLVPLLGGSGGGGSGGTYYGGGGGGGGAILIAASGQISINGSINARGGSTGDGISSYSPAGAGSGGAVRLIASSIVGKGILDAYGGFANGVLVDNSGWGGDGRIRLDSLNLNFGGTLNGVATEGYQPIILPVPGQGVQLAIESLAGLPVPANPSENPANPAVTIPSLQGTPVTVVVRCTNIPMNSRISVTINALDGTTVSASGCNLSGTQASSTASIPINMPRGGGLIHATWDGTQCSS